MIRSPRIGMSWKKAARWFCHITVIRRCRNWKPDHVAPWLGISFNELNLPGYSHILETRFLPGLTSTADQVELRMEYQSRAIIIKRQV